MPNHTWLYTGTKEAGWWYKNAGGLGYTYFY